MAARSVIVRKPEPIVAPGELYDLYSPHYPIVWPTLPQGSLTTQHVTDASSFNSASLGTQLHLVLEFDFSGAVTVSGDDILIDGQGRTITGNLTFSGCTHVRMNNLRVLGTVTWSAVSDITHDNCEFIQTDSAQSHDVRADAQVVRMAWINSTLTADNPSNGGWALHSISPGGALPLPWYYEDFIIANCLFSNVQPVLGQCFRLNAVQGLAIVDTVIGQVGGSNTFRLHTENEDVYLKNLIQVGQSVQWNQVTGSPIPNAVYNLLADNYHSYNNHPTRRWANQNGSTNTGSVENSQVYTASAPGSIIYNNLGDGGGNGNPPDSSISETWDLTENGIDFTVVPGKTALSDFGSAQAPDAVNATSSTEQFDLTNWPTQLAVTRTLNDTTAPDGTLTADKLERVGVEDTAPDNGADNGVTQEVTLSTNTVHTLSIYLKNDDSPQTDLYVLPGAFIPPVARLTIGWTGAVPSTLTSTDVSNITYTDVGNGWYRCSYTFVSDSVALHRWQIRVAKIGGFSGAGIWAWGAMIEEGTLSPYVSN